MILEPHLCHSCSKLLFIPKIGITLDIEDEEELLILEKELIEEFGSTNSSKSKASSSKSVCKAILSTSILHLMLNITDSHHLAGWNLGVGMVMILRTCQDAHVPDDKKSLICGIVAAPEVHFNLPYTFANRIRKKNLSRSVIIWLSLVRLCLLELGLWLSVVLGLGL